MPTDGDERSEKRIEIMSHKKKRILAISGSTKVNSTNDTVIRMLREWTIEKADVEQYNISHLPFFNIDLDVCHTPAIVLDFRAEIVAADALIICSPEYVFSLPGVLKNALEWTVSSASFSTKPVALIIAASQGEKAFESLQLIMRTLEAKFDDSTTLLIQGAKAKINSKETHEDINKLQQALLSKII